MNKKFLFCLADIAESIPQDEFSMAYFYPRHQVNDGIVIKTRGNIFYHFMKQNINFENLSPSEFYNALDDFDDLCGIKRYSNEWHFLFGCSWHRFDNTPTGLSYRIRYLLKKSEPSYFWFHNYAQHFQHFYKLEVFDNHKYSPLY